jgi:phosphatidylglycerol---prolipoprotein diacylglyceryl transferase
MGHPGATAYGWLAVVAVVISVVLWSRMARGDKRFLFIYISALAGAFIGAKVVYLAAEGWLYLGDQDQWLKLATGKSIIGGLLGGYIAVELAKRILQYTPATGDRFAIVAPLGIMFGRVGCILHGCCLGCPYKTSWLSAHSSGDTARWPAAQAELLFNAVALGAVLLLRRNKVLPGQHFHLYLIAYGLFRFVHEFLRATPPLIGPITGYQIAALFLFAFGAAAFARRRNTLTDSKPRTMPRLYDGEDGLREAKSEMARANFSDRP